MKSSLLSQTLIMTAVNLIMRTVSVSFNAYLTEKVGASGMGLFQLIMSVYTLAVTFSCAGIKLATTRISVETTSLKNNDTDKSLTLCVTYAGICGSVIGFILFFFSDFISQSWIDNPQTAFPLKVLSLSLPFSAMSASLAGYFTAVDYASQYSCVQLAEQGFKTAFIIVLINNLSFTNAFDSCLTIVCGITASELFSYILSYLLRKFKCREKSNKNSVNIKEILRIAVPDAVGTCVRSILLTVEHLLIPKGLKKSGYESAKALGAYGIIHAMALPVVLYPSALISSLSSLLIPSLARMNEYGDYNRIKNCIFRNIKRTIIFSFVCAFFFFIFSVPIAEFACKTKEAAKYIKILSPLVPVMYTDMITDGMLKGLDQQVYSMRYNIIDSALCVVLVITLLPVYSVKGYIFIIYISEIINFILSINRLRKLCTIYFPEHEEGISRFSRLKKCSAFPAECGYQTYRGRAKRSQVR